MRMVWIGLALLACGGDKGDDTSAGGHSHPEITAFVLDPGSGPAGAMVQSTVTVSDFVYTGGEHGDHGTHGPPLDVTPDAGDHDHGDTEGPITGHIHIYWDAIEGNPILMQVTESATLMIPEDATPGVHTLHARVHDADHLIVKPEVTFEATFEVTE